MKEAEIIISGKVQNVGFREFAEKYAKEGSLSGYVENLEDGDVYILVQGEKDNILIFIDHLHKGPMFASVNRVKVEWHEKLQDPFSDFEIW